MSFSSDADVVDILLKLSGLQAFNAGAREASASIKGIGDASEEASTKSKASGTKMSGVAGLAQKAWATSAVAVAAFALESDKMSVSFDRQMELIHTQAGATQAEVNRMSDAILKMAASGQYAQGPQQLAEGLYHLESIGLRGAKALDALKIAAQGAAVGGANLEDTTTALGSAWLVNIKGAGSLQNVMGILNATVGAGNMKMQDLVQSLGTGVLPAAKLAGLGITDVMGALATLTDEGWQGSSAMAQLATALHFLTDPTEKAQKALASIGLTATQLSNIMRTQGLQPALETLREHLAALSPAHQQQVLGNILPAGRGRVLEVLMNQVDRYGNKIKQITKTSNQFGADVAATHQNAAFKIHAAWSQIQADMIRVGHVLQPVLVLVAHDTAMVVTALVAIAPVLVHLLPLLAPIVAAFLAYKAAVLGVILATKLMDAAETASLVVLALMQGDIAAAAAEWGLLNAVMELNPIVLIVTALVALGAALVLAYTKVKWFRDAVNATFGAMVAGFHWIENTTVTVVDFIIKHWRLFILAFGLVGVAIDVVTKHWTFFRSVAVAVFNAVATSGKWMLGVLEGIFKTVYNIMVWPFQTAWKIIQAIFNGIVTAIRWVVNQVLSALHRITKPLEAVGHFIGGAASTAGSALSSVGNFLGLQSGGTITSAGAVWVGERGPELLTLPRGASVAPLRTIGTPATGALSGNNLTIVVPVQIDRREIARATGKFVDDRLARQ